MNVLKWDTFVKGNLKNGKSAAMTIGVFDGLHKGHQKLINRIIKYGSNTSIVLTFKENPRRFFKDRSYPGNVFTLSQKLNTLESMGIDTVILIDFSVNFSKLTGKDFLNLIEDNCNLSYLAFGDNFRCGYRGKTNAEHAVNILKANNTKVEIVNMTKFQNQLISSSRIRDAVSLGDFKEAKRMLGRVFSLDVADIPQTYSDKTIIIEKNNIKQVLPPQGLYVVQIGSSNGVFKEKILFNTLKIEVPLPKKQKIDYIKFI